MIRLVAGMALGVVLVVVGAGVSVARAMRREHLAATAEGIQTREWPAFGESEHR